METPSDKSPIQSINPTAVDADQQSAERKPPRRRFVQSTLFPLKPHPKKVEEIDLVEDVINVDDGDECGGSQGSGKKKRGRKPKQQQNSTPQKRRTKKVAGDGGDASVVAIDDIDSTDERSPQRLKEKQRVSTRKGRTNSTKGSPMAKTPTRRVITQQDSQTVPDLWLEAKKTSEENARIFAGKQIHPFFASRNGGKKDQETIEVESYECSNKRKERNAEFGPIHVFEDIEDDLDSTDWSHWSFYDGPFGESTSNQEREISSVGSLNVGTVLSVSYPSTTSLLLKDLFSSQNLGALEHNLATQVSVSPVEVDDDVTFYDLLKNIEKELEVNRLGFISSSVDRINSDLEQQNIPHERMMSYYLNRGNQPENSLWTNKYQPGKASEVCGNSEAVKFMNEWLRLWHASKFRVSKKFSNPDKCFINDDENDSYDSDSYAENVDEISGLKNVLLVTGPVGSGKSAAIYACAKEQGFQVIEVNASDWRNGAVLKQKFGEAVGSHLLKRSQENPVGSQGKLNFKSSAAVLANEEQAIDLNHAAVEVISLSEEEQSVEFVGMQCDTNDGLPCSQGEIKTLILFEDVDATLCEDRGFISTIQQLADTGKRPMILTSNNENPVLPDNLDREEVCFTMPSLKELICHIYLVCAAEKANVQPYLIERCAEFCRGDIRKTLTHLQYWCQRKECCNDGKIQSLYSPLMFDLEAMHCTLPKLIPWELPSSLSEFVESEIARSLCRLVEHEYFIDVIEEEAGNLQNKLDFDKGETASIEAKKEAIIRGNCFLRTDDDIVAASSACEFSNCSESPVAFTRRNVRRKLDTVLSSDSEEETFNHENPVISHGLAVNDTNNLAPVGDTHFPVPCPGLQDTFNEFGDYLRHSGATKVEEVRHQSSGTTDVNHINFAAVGNSCSQSADPLLHPVATNFTEIKHQQLQLVDLNHSIWEEPRDSLNLFNELLSRTEEVQIDVNNDRFPLMAHVHNSFPIDSFRNQSADKCFSSGEPKEEKTESLVAANHCLNSSSEQFQQRGEAKMAVSRCLFPQSAVARTGPSTCTMGNSLNQSAEQLIRCREANMAELQHCHLEMGTVNHRSQEAADHSLNPSFEQVPFCAELNMENIQQQLPETANVNPFNNAALGGSLITSSDDLCHFVGATQKEIEHKNLEAMDRIHNSCAALGENLSTDLMLRAAEMERTQQQHPGNADFIHTYLPPLNDSLEQMSKLRSKETVVGRVHQSPRMGNVDCISSPVVGNSMSPCSGKTLLFFEVKAEEQQHQYSDATDVNHIISRCLSPDMSRVPESTFVPETENIDGTELPSGTDLMEIVSPLTIGNVNTSMLSHEAPEVGQCGSDINVNPRDDEMGDSQSENDYLEASPSGCQVMDECSRMDFCNRPKRLRNFRLEAKNPVHERWHELRLTDLRQHSTSENENALEVLQLADRMSNLISEGDLLLHDCNCVINDSSDLVSSVNEGNFTFGWHDQQFQMALTFAEHGYCLYAKDFGDLQSKMGTDFRVHLAWEMLTSSSSNSMALGKLLRLNRSSSHTSLAGRRTKVASPTVDTSFKRERGTCLQNIVHSLVPLKSYLSLRGNALHDYLSSLAHMSRSEAFRLAEAAEKTKRRRVRAAKNYLSSGGLDLSQDDISLLNEYNCYGKFSSGSMFEISR